MKKNSRSAVKSGWPLSSSGKQAAILLGALISRGKRARERGREREGSRLRNGISKMRPVYLYTGIKSGNARASGGGITVIPCHLDPRSPRVIPASYIQRPQVGKTIGIYKYIPIEFKRAGQRIPRGSGFDVCLLRFFESYAWLWNIEKIHNEPSCVLWILRFSSYNIFCVFIWKNHHNVQFFISRVKRFL